MTEVTYCYSNDGEIYREDLEDATSELEDGDIYYRGVSIPATHADYFVGAGNLIETMQDAAYEVMPEGVTEDYLNMPDERLKALSELIIEWLNTNVDQPIFFRVEKIEEIVFEGDAS